MHTSSVFTSSDFAYALIQDGVHPAVGFSALFPDYHPQDRIGVVSPYLEDGVLHCGYALLACTTAFYDALRERNRDFFDYPQHFCLLDVNGQGVNTRRGRVRLDKVALGAAWSNLDVWPESKWINVAGTAKAMMQKVFDLQINRLFWPEGFHTPDDEAPLPHYARRMLATHLKQVYYYDTVQPNVEIVVTQAVEDIVLTSIERLPAVDATGSASIKAARRDIGKGSALAHVECYRRVGVIEFLESFAACFEVNAPNQIRP